MKMYHRIQEIRGNFCGTYFLEKVSFSVGQTSRKRQGLPKC